MNKLEQEAKQWMKEKRVSDISATLYQEKACETAIFPKEKDTSWKTTYRNWLTARNVVCCLAVEIIGKRD